jgi:hypothetical protein
MMDFFFFLLVVSGFLVDLLIFQGRGGCKDGTCLLLLIISLGLILAFHPYSMLIL